MTANCPGNLANCSNTEAIAEINANLGGIKSSVDVLTERVTALSDKIDERHEKHEKRMDKLDEVVLTGNGEPALRETVRSLKSARDAGRESWKSQLAFAGQIVLIVLQVVLALLLERSLSRQNHDEAAKATRAVITMSDRG